MEVAELEQQIDSLNNELRRKDAALHNLENKTIPQLRRERDEYQAQVRDKMKFYNEIQTQIEESERRSRQNSADCQGKLLEYQDENQNLRDEKSKILRQNQLLREKIVEVEGKSSSLSGRVRIESEEKSKLKTENTLLHGQLNSLKRQREWTDENLTGTLSKNVTEIDRLKDEVATYQRQALKLQQNEIEMKQQLDEMKKRKEQLKKENREYENTLSTTRKIERLQSVIRSKEIIEDRLKQAIGILEKKHEALQQEKIGMTLKLDDITQRNEQLQKEKTANETILLSIHDHKAKITQLQSIIRSKEVVEDRLRQTIADLEKKCETVQRDVYERRYDVEDRDRKKRQLKERNDKELQRLRQLEIMHENNMKSMRSMESNHTDLEKKNQQLQAEKDMLLKRESMQQNETKRLKNKLDTEERESVVLRERIKELERQNVPRYDLGMIEENRRLLAETEQLKKDFSECKQKLDRLKTTYENDVGSLKSNHTDLDKKVQHLKDEKERYYRNEQSQRRIAEELQSELEAERKISADLRERITDLRNERSEKIELERHQVSVENDREFTRLRRSKKAYKNETETLKTELADLQKNFELLEEERDQLVESEETERKMGEKLQRELDDAKREVERLQDKTQNLERQMTVSNVDRTVNEENSRLKKELEDLRIKVQKADQKFADNEETLRRYIRQVESLQRENRQAIAEKESALTRLYDMKVRDQKNKQLKERNDKELQRLRQLEIIHEENLKSMGTYFEKKNQKLQTERDMLLKRESMQQNETKRLQNKLDTEERKSAVLRERIKELERSEKKELERHQVSVENDREFTRLRRSEKAYKNEAETLKTELADLQKKFELLGDKRDKLVESGKTKRKIGENLQRELENATREVERLQENIKKLERKAEIKTGEFGSLTLTATTASQEFHTIFKREWNDAFKALSDSGLQENDILHGLHDLLTKCVGDAELECSEITKTVCRYRYFQTDPSPALVRMLKLAGLKAVVPHKTKQILQIQSNEDNGIPIPVPLAVKTYVQRCTEMAMLVRILFPQLRIVLEMESSHLNTQQYEVISGEGNVIDIVVWPYIMEKGTVVQKGYVKVRSSKQTPSISKNQEGATGISKSNDISDTGDHKYSDIEGTLIYKRNDQGKEESRNDTDSESASSMAESLTNYDLTSDFSKSFSIRQQRREDDSEGK